MMEYSGQFMDHIEYTFAAFCNVVLRNAAINAYRDFGRKQKHETIFFVLPLLFHSFPFRRLCCCTLPQREVIRERIGRE